MTPELLVVAFELAPRSRSLVEEEWGGGGAVYLRGLDPDQRTAASRTAGAA